MLPAVAPSSGLINYPHGKTGLHTYVMRQQNMNKKITSVEQVTCCVGYITSVKQEHCKQKIEKRYAISRKVVGSRTDEVKEFFQFT
jgi:hypothetical protein